MFLEFDFWGETSYKIYPNFDFWFFKLREKLSKGEKGQFWCRHSSLWKDANTVFSGCGPKIKILLPTFSLPRCLDSEKVQHNPPASKPLEEIDLAETRFFGVKAWPWGLQGPSYQRWVNFFMHGGGMGNFKPCKISTISLREACFAHFTREG